MPKTTFIIRLAFALSVVLSASLSRAQVADVGSANAAATKIVSLLNSGDAKTFESMATADFVNTIPKGALIGFVFRVHMLGTLSNPELFLDLGEQRFYKVSVTQKGKPDIKIMIVLGAESADKFFSIGLAQYVEPAANAIPLATDNRRRTAVDRAVQGAVDRYTGQNSPAGISIAVFHDGRESFYNYGGTALGKVSLPTKNTIYEIGSITKTMTGLLVSQAVIDKKLTLGDDVRKHLPGTFPNLDFQGQPILIRHLITHTSGLPANPPGIPDDAGASAYESYSHEKLLADLASVKLTKRPGSIFNYSNMGGGLCGIVLEQAYGLSYADLLQKFIFKPAKMIHSGMALTPDMDKHYATPYDVKGQATPRWTVNGIEAAGAVRSDAEDMIRYARLNLNERNPVVVLSHQLASPSGLTPTAVFWGLLQSRTAGPYLSHEGGTGGFTSNIIVMPRENLAVVILMNSGEQHAGQLGYEVALRFLNARNASKE